MDNYDCDVSIINYKACKENTAKRILKLLMITLIFSFATGVHYILKYFDKNNTQLRHLPVKASSYYWCFLYGYSFRENCYHCQYTQRNRAGDISLGDFWRFDNKNFNIIRNKGVSLVMINTEKGRTLVDNTKNKLEYCDLKSLKLSKYRRYIYNHKALLRLLVKIPKIKERL